MSVTYVTTGFAMAPAPEPSNRDRSSRTIRQLCLPSIAAAASSNAHSSSSSRSGLNGSQGSTSTSVTIVPPPAPPQPIHQAARAQFSEIDAFFGGQRQRESSPIPSDRSQSRSSSSASASPPRSSNASPTSSRGSRQNGRGRPSSSSVGNNTLPPQYESQSQFDVESLPSYSKIEEYSADLNRKLFLYGFLFFPFWIIGIIAPFVKPNHNPAIDNRSKEDQELDDANIRKIEMLWAKRCGLALLAFIIIVTIAAVVGVTVSKASHQ